MSTFSTQVAAWFHTTEQNVLAFVTDIITDVGVAEKDIAKGLSWVVSNAPNIAAGIQQVESLVATVAAATPGLNTNANVTKAIAEANVAVTALNAFATSSNTGQNNAAALVSGYVAYQTAQAAVASAKAAVVSAPVVAD